jgi:DNA end-binding protein Ku
MRAIWKGTITFGLVTIPVALHPATRREELKFRLLRDSDLSPVNYKRVAEADGKEVPWEHIVKGYEYDKDRYVVLKEEDFKRVDLEATQSVDIVDFVNVSEIDPRYFHKPYFLEPQKGGEKAYALLRNVLKNTNKVGIAKVVIRKREHLAAVKPQGNALVLELMHFKEELADTDGLKMPKEKEFSKKEVDMATSLVETLSDKWNPEKYKDEYRHALMELIEKKAEGEPVPAAKHPRQPTKVIDLVSVLQKSIEESQKGRKPAASKAPKRKAA